MKSRFAITVLSFFLLLSGCATNEAEGPSLYERIKTAQQSIKIVSSTSPDWCGPAKSCKYIGEIYCEYDDDDNRDKKAKACKKNINSRIVQYGGDTYVQQEAGMVKKTYDHYRSFGQVYNCNDTNQQLHKEYAAENKLKPLSKLRVDSKPYAEQCKTINNCTKNERKWSCGSMQGDPYMKCRAKFDRDQKQGTSKTNYIVVKNDLVNGAGIYRLYIDSYECK